MNSKFVLQSTLPEGKNVVDVSSLQSGAYLLMLQDDEKVYQAVFVRDR